MEQNLRFLELNSILAGPEGGPGWSGFSVGSSCHVNYIFDKTKKRIFPSYVFDKIPSGFPETEKIIFSRKRNPNTEKVVKLKTQQSFLKKGARNKFYSP